MGTKNNPGDFDCYDKADPDEPMFVLLARDPRAPALVRAWASESERIGDPYAKVQEARDCADAMERWYNEQPVVLQSLTDGGDE